MCSFDVEWLDHDLVIHYTVGGHVGGFQMGLF